MFKASRALGTSHGRVPARSSLFFTVFFLASWFQAGAPTPAAAQSGGQITAARTWPAQDYTRVTLESQEPLKYTVLNLKDPERLVLDLEDIEVTATLTGLAEKIGANDPYVKGMRVGRFKPGVMRVHGGINKYFLGMVFL